MSADQTVRTSFIWDTTGVREGAGIIRKAYRDTAKERLDFYKQEQAAERRAASHGGGSNIIQGFKDIAEGRVMFGLQRIVPKFAAVGIAALVAARKVRELSDEIRASAKTLNDYSSGSVAASRPGSFQSRASSTDEIGSEFMRANASMREGKDKLMEEGEKRNLALNPMGESLYRLRSVMSMGANWLNNKTGNHVRLTEYEPLERAEENASLATEFQRKRSRAAQANMQASLYSQGTVIGATARSGGIMSEAFQKQESLNLEKLLSDEKLRAMGFGEKELALNARIFNFRRDILYNEIALSKIRSSAAAEELRLQGGGGSAFSKSLGSATAQFKLSGALMDSGRLTNEQMREESNTQLGARNAQRSSLMGRYLDPDTGRRRRNGVIQREFRNERNATRRRNAFLRQSARGGFDMETGRRTAIHRGMDGEILNALPAIGNGLAKKNEITPEAALLEKLIEIVGSRLPEKN